MRHSPLVFASIYAVLSACAPQPAYIECEPGLSACPDRCVDLDRDDRDCGLCGNECRADETCSAGRCVPTTPADACATNNGGCSPEAFCMDIAGSAECLCRPGFTGSGISCAACTNCDLEQFAAMPCTPFDDTVCAACTPPCTSGTFEFSPCMPLGNRVCFPCTECGVGMYTAAPCGPTTDTVCQPCETGCLSCSGPGPTCVDCDIGFVLSNGMCLPAIRGQTEQP